MPFLKEAKEICYFHARRRLHIPHENDFKILKSIHTRLRGCYIDVGANRGQSIESILLFVPKAEIISFEANPNLAKKLTARYRGQNRIRIVAAGLGDSPGKSTLFVPSYNGLVYDALASLDRGSAASWLSKETIVGFRPQKLTISELCCKVTTLDSLQLSPAFIKIDVQGYEYHVLCGGRETLRKYEPIVLLESFRNDPRTVNLAEELGYEEYHGDDSGFRKGALTGEPNSFLITRARWAELVHTSSSL
jgi:FkbM family methyltransferase